MNVKNVEKENGSAKVTVEIAKDEFQTALDKACLLYTSPSPRDTR